MNKRDFASDNEPVIPTHNSFLMNISGGVLVAIVIFLLAFAGIAWWSHTHTNAGSRHDETPPAQQRR
jgi:hypothetical protein